MTKPRDSLKRQTVIGVDLGGTKCAAGLVSLPDGNVLARRLEPTRPERGGEAVLSSVVELAKSLERQAAELNHSVAAIGLGVAELVGIDGQVLSDATIRWRGIAVRENLEAATGLAVTIDADVRAAARAEAHLGAGRRFRSFQYITVGTGISSCLVIDRMPYAGARGLTGTFASSAGLIPADDGTLAAGPPLEQFAAGPALATRLAAVRRDFTGTAFDVVAAAEEGDLAAAGIVESAGSALGAAIGQLVNVLDPEAVVIGGGLGLAGGKYRAALEAAMRNSIWSELHRDVALLNAEMGTDAGFIGATLAAVANEQRNRA
ncbi:MAG: ROK family protein [Pirellulales bacterium]